MMGAWQIGRSEREPLTAGDFEAGMLELTDSLTNNADGWATEVDGEALVDVIVLVSGVVQRGQLIAVRVPLRDIRGASDG